MLFMINIIASIVPIRVFSLVLTFLLARSITRLNLSDLLFGWFDLEGLECCFIGCGELHLMGVYDFMLLLNVKSVCLGYHMGCAVLGWVLLLIV
jgi:hypothetical protein